MAIRVYNRTPALIELKSFYVWDTEHNVRIEGSKRYRIPANEDLCIPSYVFARMVLKRRVPVEIHVIIREEVRLVLDPANFTKSEEVFFEMHDDSLRPRFTPRTETTSAGGIRFPFCGSGCSTD